MTSLAKEMYNRVLFSQQGYFHVESKLTEFDSRLFVIISYLWGNHAIKNGLICVPKEDMIHVPQSIANGHEDYISVQPPYLTWNQLNNRRLTFKSEFRQNLII